MKRQEFRRRLQNGVLLLDGATGTELSRLGMPAGAAPEAWALDHPDILESIHAAYLEAGSDIVYTATFGANRVKLADHRLQNDVERLNRGLAGIARRAVRKTRPDAWVFGCLSPTGQLLAPTGMFDFEEAVDVFRQQAAHLAAGGVDGFVLETMIDVQEARAALLGVRAAAPDSPVMASLSFGADGRTLAGTTPEAAIVTLQALGADAVGCNCSTGPEDVLRFLALMRPFARVPLLAKPNAGLPSARDGQVRYSVGPDEFARDAERFLRMGARLIGGCCGAAPGHIAAARRAAAAIPPLSWKDSVPGKDVAAASSLARARAFAPPGAAGGPVVLIGERINPTGKKAFQAELRAGNLDGLRRLADEQTEAGADLLDVNVGLAGLNEAELLGRAARMLAAASAAPLVFDSADPEAVEGALRRYPGRALVNSISAEPARLERLLPVAARYGAMLIALPVTAGGVPETAAERMAAARRVMEAARAAGYGDADVLVDGLAMAVAGNGRAGLETLAFLDMAAREGPWRTLVGLSNVSFGLPGRAKVNAAFLAMAMAKGLTAVIANPLAEGLMDMVAAANGVLGRDAGMAKLIEHFGKPPPAAPATPPSPRAADAPDSSRTSAHFPARQRARAPESPLFPGGEAGRAVLRGELNRAAVFSEKALAAGVSAGELLDRHLIPAISEAGRLYEARTYYLPQLMLAGEAMRRALAVVSPVLAGERAREGGMRRARGKAVLATVEGDVHDIGKNLVALMLGNHGYAVTDLGKDVSPKALVEACLGESADLAGLSALMTTTLPAMRRAVEAIREAGLPCRVMVGGAAVTEAYAGEIGADGYAPDAVEAVRLADRLMRMKGDS